jgi:hypothetical protein
VDDRSCSFNLLLTNLLCQLLCHGLMRF